jgi:hypothetical protein
MARCEDYPCCGHEAGDCPTIDSNGNRRWTCVECGKRLPLKARSSICNGCLRRAQSRFARGEEMFDDRDR